MYLESYSCVLTRSFDATNPSTDFSSEFKEPLISCNVLAMYTKETSSLAEACFGVDLVGGMTSSSLSGNFQGISR